MKCPFCSYQEDKVVDSRTSKNGMAIRRRRECLQCSKRFTTYEQVEDILPMVVKKDNRREPFDRFKIVSGMRKACEKRPVAMEMLEQAVDEIEKVIQNKMEKEVPASEIGDLVMRKLAELDEVAYVRFASVYRQFKDINAFMEEVKNLLASQKQE
ncbi:transcriptional repressor NrdR [candidate division FCPU426 bacterium]|nr:transcriptional repressor NrdR [candidate division FCPU426 bacterium]